MVDAQTDHRLLDCSAPKSERVPQHQFAVERDAVVSERQRRTLDAPRLRPQQPGRKANQARLAAAVGTADLEPLAGPEIEIERLEQQFAAATERDFPEPEQCSHRTASSSACMSSSLRPK